MISLLVSLLIICLVAGLVLWIISLIPLPPPWGRVAQAIVALIILIVLINWMIPMVPHPLWSR
jgi:hypothetical protein